MLQNIFVNYLLHLLIFVLKKFAQSKKSYHFCALFRWLKKSQWDKTSKRIIKRILKWNHYLLLGKCAHDATRQSLCWPYWCQPSNYHVATINLIKPQHNYSLLTFFLKKICIFIINVWYLYFISPKRWKKIAAKMRFWFSIVKKIKFLQTKYLINY